MDDDLRLVEQCLEGDRKAFECIVDKYQKPMFNAALRILNDCEDAADAAQSAFIKAYENLRAYNKRYKFFSWLYRIAINESLNLLQQRRKFEGINEEIVSNDKTPEERYREKETSQRIQSALMEMDLDYRVVIVLSHFQDLSYKEMSYILDIPEKTVKSRLFSARQLLRSILQREGLFR